MTKYIALLRGINVGGNNKVEMKRLKTVFEQLGFTNVSTYINSGNVVFESSSKPISKDIENAIQAEFGFAVPTLVRSTENLITLVKAIPDDWTNDTNQKTDVLFLWEEYDSAKTLDLITTNPDVDVLQYIEGCIVWHVDRTVYNKSGMHKFVGTQVYKHMTARNINTVRKLVEITQL